MDDIVALLQGDREPWLYTITQPDFDIDALSSLCQTHHHQLFVIDGESIATKAAFLAAAAASLNFPDYFGENWDAFYDCLTDLDKGGAKGYVLLYTQPENFAEANPADWLILVELLQDAIQFWAEQHNTPLIVLLKTPKRLLPNDSENL
jgi:hypothetical protein